MASNDMDRVVPLGRLSDFQVADGDPDVRGWEVRAADGRKIGAVDELLVDTAAMKVRYLEVGVDDGVMGDRDDRHVLIPIGLARLERDHDCVMVDALTSGDLSGMPRYARGEPLSRDYENSVRDRFSRGTGVDGTGASAGLTVGALGGTTADAELDTIGMANTPGTGTGLGATGLGMPMADSGMGLTSPATNDTSTTGREPMESREPMRGADADIAADERGRAMQGDASHRQGEDASDYMHNSDEDFYATDAFDPDRFYSTRRDSMESSGPSGAMMGSGFGDGGMREPGDSAGEPRRGMSGGVGGTTGGGMRDEREAMDETRRAADDASQRLREDRDNRGVGGREI